MDVLHKERSVEVILGDFVGVFLKTGIERIGMQKSES